MQRKTLFHITKRFYTVEPLSFRMRNAKIREASQLVGPILFGKKANMVGVGNEVFVELYDKRGGKYKGPFFFFVFFWSPKKVSMKISPKQLLLLFLTNKQTKIERGQK